MDSHKNVLFRVWDDNGIVGFPRAESKIGWVIRAILRNGIWKPAAWVIVSVKHIFDTVSCLRSS